MILIIGAIVLLILLIWKFYEIESFVLGGRSGDPHIETDFKAVLMAAACGAAMGASAFIYNSFYDNSITEVGCNGFLGQTFNLAPYFFCLMFSLCTYRAFAYEQELPRKIKRTLFLFTAMLVAAAGGAAGSVLVLVLLVFYFVIAVFFKATLGQSNLKGTKWTVRYSDGTSEEAECTGTGPLGEKHLETRSGRKHTVS